MIGKTSSFAAALLLTSANAFAQASDAEPAAAPPPAAAASATPPPSAPPSAPAATEIGTEINARVGLKFPGNMAPVNWFDTQTGTALFLGADASKLLGRYFSVGAYLAFSPFSFDRMSGSRTIGKGSGYLLSGGATAKGRLPVADDALILRAGLTLGVNGVNYDGESDTNGKFSLSGFGLQVGMDIDAVVRVSPSVGVVGQLGFLAQPLGTASVKGYPTKITAEGSDRKFGFAPIFVLSVGPEFRF